MLRVAEMLFGLGLVGNMSALLKRVTRDETYKESEDQRAIGYVAYSVTVHPCRPAF